MDRPGRPCALRPTADGAGSEQPPRPPAQPRATPRARVGRARRRPRLV